MKHAFNPSIRDAEVVSPRPAGFPNQVLGQPGLGHREIISKYQKKKRERDPMERLLYCCISSIINKLKWINIRFCHNIIA